MKLAMRLEFRKMRRLRTIPIVIMLIAAAAAMSSASLFSTSTRETFDDPAAAPWAALLLTYTMMAAMTSPILMSVLASRQTDIEHSGAGWTLAATAGVTPGSLCRAKLATLSLVLLPAVALQTLMVVGAGVLAGIRVSFSPGPWVGYALLLFGVNLAFCALHIWLAAVVENQLISVGIGMLGAFLAVFSMLIPGSITRIIPWGYYATISHVGQQGNQVLYLQPPYFSIVTFLTIVGGLFVVGTRRLNHMER